MRSKVALLAVVVLLAALTGGGWLLFPRLAGDGLPGRGPGGQSDPAGTKAILADEVVFMEVADPAKAVEMLEAGQLHVYASGLSDPELERKIRASPALEYKTSYGSYVELSFNPVGPTFPGTDRLNPFHVVAVREAMNWLVDRSYIAEEIYGGLARPRYLPLTSAFPDYARLAHVARALEIQYAHQPEKARTIITREMEGLGAARVNGTWHYRGRPVELIFLIRSEDERREIGDQVATQLEGLGFRVDRQYKTAAEASRIWIGSDPGEGRWHLYTGGWVTTSISRDQAGNFNFFYTPRGRPEPLWQAYRPIPRLDEIADSLARRAYATWEERQDLMAEALRLTMQDSVRIWLADTISVWPHRKEVAVAADLAGGISGSWLWPYTLRFLDREGGRVTIGMPSILTEPWNPVAGTNWIFDQMIIRASAESVVLPDPFTGLPWPRKIKSAQVYVEEGLPVTKTHDWVELSFVPSIQVPEDAWIDWNPVQQRFISVREAHPEGLSARTKTIVHYVDNLYEQRWHDGTKMSLADLILGLILTFDRAKEQSAIFDEAEVPAFETFVRHFRGARIVQEDPLVAEVYSDQVLPDAELMSRAGFFYATEPWHNVVIGILAEANRELAFSKGKADRLRVEWASYIAGPSLSILERYRLQALEQSLIPYANTLGTYITGDQARERYTALGDWYRERRHFWVGQGPYYLHSVHPVEKIVVVRRSDAYRDVDERWLAYTKPQIAQLEISGPSRVATEPAEFRVSVTFQGEPYPMRDMDSVRFLVFDAEGQMAIVNEAQAVRDGQWRIALTSEQTARLPAGPNRLEVVAVPRVVSIPSFHSFTFVKRSVPDVIN